MTKPKENPTSPPKPAKGRAYVKIIVGLIVAGALFATYRNSVPQDFSFRFELPENVVGTSANAQDSDSEDDASSDSDPSTNPEVAQGVAETLFSQTRSACFTAVNTIITSAAMDFIRDGQQTPSVMTYLIQKQREINQRTTALGQSLGVAEGTPEIRAQVNAPTIDSAAIALAIELVQQGKIPATTGITLSTCAQQTNQQLEQLYPQFPLAYQEPSIDLAPNEILDPALPLVEFDDSNVLDSEVTE